jgi:hypothetical protein
MFAPSETPTPTPLSSSRHRDSRKSNSSKQNVTEFAQMLASVSCLRPKQGPATLLCIRRHYPRRNLETISHFLPTGSASEQDV